MQAPEDHNQVRRISGEMRVIALERMAAHMARRLLPADHQRVAIVSRGLHGFEPSADEMRCGMAHEGSSLGTSALTNDIPGLGVGPGCRPLPLSRGNQEYR